MNLMVLKNPLAISVEHRFEERLEVRLDVGRGLKRNLHCKLESEGREADEIWMLERVELKSISFECLLERSEGDRSLGGK